MDFSQFTAGIRESFSELIRWLIAQQPRLLSAVALLAAGWLLALLLRILAVRFIRAIERIVPGRALRGGLPRLTIERQVSDIIGLIVFWAVLLFFVAAAADALGLPVLSASLAGLGFYVPRLLGAVLVIVVGLVVGNLARDAVTAAAAGAPFAASVGQIARVSIVTAASLIAVAGLGIDITLLTAILSVALAAVLGAFALAFGLGARTAVSNIIGAHYLRQTFEPGHVVRFGEIEGTVASITSTSVVIRVADGQVVVPAKQFSESVSMLVTSGGSR
ncbi:MAG TPA: mechanosensitive ion channel domain-containing protein [Vicinamibacterales bacterium]|nr:mechanosensitive ion channel domain-containing protein [Vicinamibacterales bacterium]